MTQTRRDDLRDLLNIAEDAYREGDFRAAHVILAHLVGHGSAPARFYLARLYETGRGVRKCETTAAGHYAWAAAAGIREAGNNLGRMYFEGRGVDRDPQAGLRLLKESAMRGDTDAANTLASIFWHGVDGVAKDAIESYAWCTVAREQGDELADKNAEVVEAESDAEVLTAGRIYGGLLVDRLNDSETESVHAAPVQIADEVAATA